MSSADDFRSEEPPVVVRDRRRIDPTTGAVRARQPETAQRPTAETPQGAAAGVEAGLRATDTLPADATAELRARLDERTADLQRVTAEYANYRKRVDRDREAVAQIAKASVVADLLSVLDDLDRAEAHGDLTGPFRAVADKVTAALQRAGLRAFGQVGEPFNPVLHEAVQHTTSPDVNGPTVTAVLRRGYTFGDRVLRPAMVAVTDHEPAAESVDGLATEPVGGLATEPVGGLATEPVGGLATEPVGGPIGGAAPESAPPVEDVLLEPEPPGAVAHPDGAGREPGIGH